VDKIPKVAILVCVTLHAYCSLINKVKTKKELQLLQLRAQERIYSILLNETHSLL
jgi:hypothetical protein